MGNGDVTMSNNRQKKAWKWWIYAFCRSKPNYPYGLRDGKTLSFSESTLEDKWVR